MWTALKENAEKIKHRSIAGLFEDPNRASDFSLHVDGLFFDYSKTNIDVAAKADLLGLLERCDLEQWRNDMFEGQPINTTEDRAVLHTALRNLDGGPVDVDGADVMPNIKASLSRMEALANGVRGGTWPNGSCKITDVVNIGIGGSDLGPAMAVQGLAPYHDGPKCHFVSNLDSADLTDCIKTLDPTTTMVIVASKSFATQETLTNARSALEWMRRAGGDPLQRFVALSTSEERTRDFGISSDNVFGFEDWVGGRYSIWGPIGLSLMIAIGPDAFFDFLRGGQAMDTHFKSAPFEKNLPVLLALTGVWHHQVCGYATRAVIPYEQRLSRLAAYFQQLEMESNGKRVRRDGINLDCVSGPVVWGEPGTNGQHAFFQLIHQGTAVVPCEFMVGVQNHEPHMTEHHDALVANCLAQSAALMHGRTLEVAQAQLQEKGVSGAKLEVLARQRVCPGNRPSTTLVFPKLTPFVLGQIIALYEHRVFVEGILLQINSFDQWGVELGKELACRLIPAVAERAVPEDTSPSTRQLLEFIFQTRDAS